MSERWIFNYNRGTKLVELRARLEGEGGLVGHAYSEFGPNDRLLVKNLNYAELVRAGVGVVIIENGVARIEREPPRRRRRR